jgi:N-acyl-D-aspartate/D-glutamate deacylase
VHLSGTAAARRRNILEERGVVSGYTTNLDMGQLGFISIASDGAAVNLTGATDPHPRAYGSNARVLGHYVHDLKLLTLEEATAR